MLPEEEIIISKEKAILNRWKTGDTFGFADADADEITYFDPVQHCYCLWRAKPLPLPLF